MKPEAFVADWKRSEVSEVQDFVQSADVVGLMCLKIFCEKKDEYRSLKSYAKSLGSAFQKVNFLRDFHEDYELKGRTYFPELEMNRTFDESSKKQIEMDIEKDFNEAIKGIKKLPRSCCLGVYLAYSYYKKLLNKIKSTPASKILITRIRVNNFQKFLLLPSALLFSLFLRRS